MRCVRPRGCGRAVGRDDRARQGAGGGRRLRQLPHRRSRKAVRRRPANPTPFGGIYAPNLTPDRETGLGNWRDEDFLRALRFGVRPDGSRYYPAFPYPNFTILVRDDMPDEVAHLLTWCAVEARQELERQYMSVPVNRSPVTYPFDPKKMATTSIPLHPGASKYYREAGYL